MITVLRELRSIILSSLIFLPIIVKSPNSHLENSLLMDETSSPFTLFIKSTQSCSKGKEKITGGISNIHRKVSRGEQGIMNYEVEIGMLGNASTFRLRSRQALFRSGLKALCAQGDNKLKLFQYFFHQLRSDFDSVLSIRTINLTYVTNEHEPRPFVNCLFVVLYQVYQVFSG